MDYLIHTENLSKFYDVGSVKYNALQGVDISVGYNELAAIVGPSGSGKSTLLHLIGGLDRPSSGIVRVEGNNLSELSEQDLADYRSKKVGFVFQFFNLIPYLSAQENLELSMSIARINKKERKTRALELLKVFGLESLAKKKPTELSGGEQQRTAIARALVNSPSLILADEPTGNLDTASSIVVMDAFRELIEKRKVSVIMVTHNHELMKYCDRIIKLRDGKLESMEIKK
ncbi:ABC transporter ATP-binding protein [Candidatus Bathyarchaeota archaeon]|nr:ABC transporter ATP-binding protein [Candidatus Bathyarchaeota archaeon]